MNEQDLLDSPSILWDSPWLAFNPSPGTLRYLPVAAFKRTSTSGSSRLALRSTRAIVINRQTVERPYIPPRGASGPPIARNLKLGQAYRYLPTGKPHVYVHKPAGLGNRFGTSGTLQLQGAGRHIQSAQRVRKESSGSHLKRLLLLCRKRDIMKWIAKYTEIIMEYIWRTYLKF